ncbi:MAG: diacylglycerol kinase [Patescibacteria group bacterium]
MFSLKRLFNSFSYASTGLKRVFIEEQNFRLQALAAFLVICAMFVFDLSWLERSVLTLAMALVLVLELMNSIFERIVDLLKPRVHLHVKEIKDVMAGTVLVAATAAILIGLMILGPYLSLSLFG